MALLAAGCSSADDSEVGSGDQNVTSGDLNARLDALYSNPANWRKVADKAYGLVGFSTPPCATFMSTALEMLAGVPFPKGLGTTIVPTKFPADLNADFDVVRQILPFSHGRFEIRTNTSGLTDYLIERLGWQVIWDTELLEPGDIIMTMPGSPARHPTHAYMFHGWQDKAEGWGWAIDNEADGHCSDGDDTFVEFCGPNGSGKQLCCKAAGQHIYKRSLTKEVPEPYNPKETDDPMWFALRATNPSAAPAGGCADDVGCAPQAPMPPAPKIDDFAAAVFLGHTYANVEPFAGLGRVARFGCTVDDKHAATCTFDVYDGDKATDTRTVKSALTQVTHGADCSQGPTAELTATLQITDDGQGGHDYPFVYDVTFDCTAQRIALRSADDGKGAPDTLALKL